ncbi:MAG: DNA/RNA nuclease SfsA [Candidatus Bathyarchaeota archaeon]|nr:DNA/RNA nuclease SfsA [Candidatus Bathyarchaeum tardum]WGM90330.1 MAG: DNA/RNA nuclease SfsA [Candidatus Bathyarchaeum tardum]WNZ29591.1 MAG: DNA/RNA nuclease SfsA [Candidatus Bathyarchaeota archaeon]
MVSFIEIDGKLLKGHFVERLNRFLAQVEVNGTVESCFLPNPGRMRELLVPGVEVLVRDAEKKNRKTKFDLIGVMHEGELVSLDTMVPNKLVFEALKNKAIEEFSRYNFVKPEQAYGHSRFDFFLANDDEKCLLEIKSCSLVEDGVALFPDAPTTRGRRHLLELIEAKKEGYRACVLFVIQRVNAHVFGPNDKTDPDFGEAFRLALKNGVESYAYFSEFVGNRVFLRNKVVVKPSV